MMREKRFAASSFVVVAAVVSASVAGGCSRELTEDEVREGFLDAWNASVGMYQDSHFLGIQTLQNPTDAWITQEIIQEVKPDIIVEAGAWKGGSAAYWATILEQVNPDGEVITIDVEDQTAEAQKLAIWKRRITFLSGSSTAPEILAEVKRRAEGKRALVILDSLHTHQHVLDELRLYSPLVPKGSYVIVQDSGLWVPPSQDKPGGWPYAAIQDFIAETDEFVIDEKRERFLITNNVGGYLKRVR